MDLGDDLDSEDPKAREIRLFVEITRGTLCEPARKVNKFLKVVNPKLKCHPNAQSRSVTYLRRMQSSPRRSRASIEFSVKSKRRQGCDIGTGPRFGFGRSALLAL